MSTTLDQYRQARDTCRDLFARKMSDYGTSWRIMRLPSLTDQLYIKAKRIRSLEQGEARIDEGIPGEFVALVNYAFLALVQESLGDEEAIELPPKTRFSPLRHGCRRKPSSSCSTKTTTTARLGGTCASRRSPTSSS